jgi:hypothetical protein
MKTTTRVLCTLLLLTAASTLIVVAACGDDGNEIPANEVPYCQQECTKADDCCATPPCDKGADAEACISGICKFVGCSADTDCKDPTGGTLKMVWKCETAKFEGRTVGMCIPTCSADTDCPKIPFVNIQLVCKAVTQYNHTANTCVIPCTSDQACSAFQSKCNSAGYCDWFSAAEPDCKSDADCATHVGQKKCDVARGACYCESDQLCTADYQAIGDTHTYKCLK